jgi:lysyl-tRNA synthetase class 2
MLESYQAYATYETLMPMAERLIRHVDGFVRAGLERDGLNVYLERWLAERQFTFDEPFARVPLRRALERALRIAELPLDLIDQLETLGRVSADKRASDAKASAGSELIDSLRERSRRNIDWKNLTAALGGCASAGERLFVAYEYIAEPFLPDDYRSSDGKYSLPVFITDYPAETSPLARRKDSDPTLVDRFELFVQHLELCNAFSELNDPDDQAARFRDQMDKKQGGAAEAMDYDADYVLALEHGMPPAAGFGMGIDRLVMTLAAQPSIRDVIAFPLLRPETGT